jgi:lipid II:glycine glycyltransferase (peptidoglycan interpeptide bridge formation enzyme)
MSGEIEAAALILIATLPLINAGIAYVKFGPLWQCRGKTLRPELLTASLRAIADHFANKQGLLVRIMPPADPERRREWSQSFAAAQFRLHRTIAHPERYLIDLTLSEEKQLASLHAKWRANLKRASSQLRIGEVDPCAALPIFVQLYKSMSERKQFADRHHIDRVPAFVHAAPPELNLRMFLAEADGLPVAASLVVAAGDRALVPFSASNAAALPLRAGFALRWEIMNSLRASTSRWLDIGGDEGDAGLRHFKAGNVGATGRIVARPGDECKRLRSSP